MPHRVDPVEAQPPFFSLVNHLGEHRDRSVCLIGSIAEVMVQPRNIGTGELGVAEIGRH
jgi:hypothetical protein